MQKTCTTFGVGNRNLKLKTTIATQNVQTMLQNTNLVNIKQDMKRMKVKIQGMSKIRWQGPGKITPGTFKIFYSRRTEREGRIELDLGMGNTSIRCYQIMFYFYTL